MTVRTRIELLGWDQARARAAAIRRAVFIEEQGVPESLEWDEHDAMAVHALALDLDGRAVATGRLVVVPGAREARIGRMAVQRELRRQGLGGRVLTALLDAAACQGILRVMLHAQVAVVPFYHRFGFAGTGGQFEEAGIPHIGMELVPASRKV